MYHHLRTDLERTKLPKPRDDGVIAGLTGIGIFVVGPGEGDQPWRSTGILLPPRKLRRDPDDSTELMLDVLVRPPLFMLSDARSNRDGGGSLAALPFTSRPLVTKRVGVRIIS